MTVSNDQVTQAYAYIGISTGAGRKNQEPDTSRAGYHLISYTAMSFNANNEIKPFSNDPSLPNPSFGGSTPSPNRFGALGNSRHGGASRTNRTACVLCRKRKLKCDGNKPRCATCARLGHECAYDDARTLGGSKRGYVLELEARLGCGMTPVG